MVARALAKTKVGRLRDRDGCGTLTRLMEAVGIDDLGRKPTSVTRACVA